MEILHTFVNEDRKYQTHPLKVLTNEKRGGLKSGSIR
jgi:hypothetical protein